MGGRATAEDIERLAGADLSPPERLAAAAAILARGVPHAGALDRALASLRAEGFARFQPADSPRIWQRYGAELGREGRSAEAETALRLALALAPGDGETLIALGTLAFQAADLAAAHRHFAAAKARPDDAAAHAALAATAAREGAIQAARTHGARALALDPAIPAAHLALARADLAAGDAAAAESRLSARLASGLDAANSVAFHDLRAEAREQLGQFAAAFADWKERNRLLAEGLALPREERYLARARRLADALAAGRPWPRAAEPDRHSPAATHVFLLGFPRSGTTLLEKALAGHPAIVTLEEVDHLGPVAGPLLAPGAIDRLPQLSRTEADAARRAYWAGIAPMLADRDRSVVVDKMPLHTLLLPAIARLFPDARILFAVRDPRDVVLSCFRRRFRLNAAMAEFLSLEGAAGFYAATMALAAEAREKLPLTVHLVRHEELVTGFEPGMRDILAFLGLGWAESVRDVAGRAAERAVTPSDLQLRRGLSAEGIGQWRRYADELAPVLPVLAHWVRHFGYG